MLEVNFKGGNLLSGPPSLVTASTKRSWRSAVHLSLGFGSLVITTPFSYPCLPTPPPPPPYILSGITTNSTYWYPPNGGAEHFSFYNCSCSALILPLYPFSKENSNSQKQSVTNGGFFFSSGPDSEASKLWKKEGQKDCFEEKIRSGPKSKRVGGKEVWERERERDRVVCSRSDPLFPFPSDLSRELENDFLKVQFPSFRFPLQNELVNVGLDMIGTRKSTEWICMNSWRDKFKLRKIK